MTDYLIEHAWKGGYGKPFRANCTICGERKQMPIHTEVTKNDNEV
jgi:hypothetical protein